MLDDDVVSGIWAHSTVLIKKAIWLFDNSTRGSSNYIDQIIIHFIKRIGQCADIGAAMPIICYCATIIIFDAGACSILIYIVENAVVATVGKATCCLQWPGEGSSSCSGSMRSMALWAEHLEVFCYALLYGCILRGRDARVCGIIPVHGKVAAALFVLGICHAGKGYSSDKKCVG